MSIVSISIALDGMWLLAIKHPEAALGGVNFIVARGTFFFFGAGRGVANAPSLCFLLQ